MADITLARALKIKNRLVGLANKLSQRVLQSNSVYAYESAEPQFNYQVPELLEKRDMVLGALIALKSKISIANQEVTIKIYTIAESKAQVSFYNQIDTNVNLTPYDFEDSSNKVQKHVQVGSTFVDARIAEFEKDINRLQDELDEFNASTKIEVSDEVMALLE